MDSCNWYHFQVLPTIAHFELFGQQRRAMSLVHTTAVKIRNQELSAESDFSPFVTLIRSCHVVVKLDSDVPASSAIST